MAVTYNLDTSGVNPANLVENEAHSVNEAQFRDYFFLVPNFAPFFVDNFKLKLITQGAERDLNEDVDFSFALPYVTGTRTTGKQMYGAITLHNLEMNGILSLQYQTIGGDQVVDRLFVLSYLADKAYNPRTTIWDIITNVPNAFPPVPHYQDYDDYKGQEAVVEKLAEIRDAILTNSSLTSQTIADFLEQFMDGSSAVYVRRTGDTMTGPLILSESPVSPMQAATKEFVEQSTISQSTLASELANYVTNAILMENMATKLSVTGGIMTGPIKLSSDPVVDEDAVRKAYVDGLVSGLNLSINNLAAAINNLQTTTASKTYVNDLIAEVMTRVNATAIQRV